MKTHNDVTLAVMNTLVNYVMNELVESKRQSSDTDQPKQKL